MRNDGISTNFINHRFFFAHFLNHIKTTNSKTCAIMTVTTSHTIIYSFFSYRTNKSTQTPLSSPKFTTQLSKTSLANFDIESSFKRSDRFSQFKYFHYSPNVPIHKTFSVIKCSISNGHNDGISLSLPIRKISKPILSPVI